MPINGPDYDSSAISRRTLIKTAAGAGIAIAVAGTVGVANAGATDHGHAAADAVAAGAPLTAGEATHVSGAVVVHVVDPHAGTLEKFADGTRTQVHDADLTSRIGHLAADGPVVVHVLNAGTGTGTGTVDVFSKGAHSQIRNHDLAARIIRTA